MPTINQCEIFDRPRANGMMVEFAKNVADFAADSGKKHNVVLSSLDFGRWQTVDMSSWCACGESGVAFPYHCCTCSFDLHVGCASLPESENCDDHEHCLLSSILSQRKSKN
ncbi:hypothetical protein LOK49_LG05G02767 [Camellia lanceoleosa]|uniref:Uncharacterized protein n=1 Tax=Camellia lanceoleosa TaxID=1840588 RepID=A0ACC0HT06_9ERIC|nr:hypothetical protein LOK49_LG05G02767 [Camellia lanceoleosa]